MKYSCLYLQGHLITKEKATRIAEGPDGLILSQHFATPFHRGFVVNGYSLKSNERESAFEGGVPLALNDLKGIGGGSFCNHSDTANARLERWEGDNGCAIFVISIRDIMRGEFIHVDYGQSFLRSSRSNISQEDICQL